MGEEDPRSYSGKNAELLSFFETQEALYQVYRGNYVGPKSDGTTVSLVSSNYQLNFRSWVFDKLLGGKHSKTRNTVQHCKSIELIER